MGLNNFSLFCSDDGYDSSARSVAYEILLKSQPSKKTFYHLLAIVGQNQEKLPEFSAFCINRLYDQSSQSAHLRELIR